MIVMGNITSYISIFIKDAYHPLPSEQNLPKQQQKPASINKYKNNPNKVLTHKINSL
ncbi:hypothetical protein GCM10009129_23230 [Psychrobacter aestuarii]|uniref:Uncharacterized protein n=1 Tax=Psychrobacter aestuarii TaxID=556327 RepID=A0ABP3FTS8_9GAMM